MNFLKVFIIAFLAVFFSSDTFAQVIQELPPSCSDKFTMRIEGPTIETNPDRECYVVWIESVDGTPLSKVFASSYDGHCTTNFSGSDDRFGAAFCFGEDSCGPDDPDPIQTIWCGINNKYGNMLCRDGCTVVIGDGA